MKIYLCDALHYRETCIICGHQLETRAQIRDSETKVLPNKITVEAGERSLFLNYDGYFTRTKMRKTDFQPMTFARLCPLCDRNMGMVKKYGSSSLIESMYNQYFYTFDVFADVETGTYFTALNSEFISITENQKMYHIETSFHLKESRLYHGSNISDMMRKTLPIINIKSIEDKESFKSKIKLYSVFS